MTSPNFGALLDKAPSEVQRPPTAPQGQYLWIVKGLPRYDKSSKKQTEFTEFNLQCLQAGPDVDAEELDAYLTDKETGDKRGIDTLTTKATFYHTDRAIWMLDKFHEDCGLDLSVEASRRDRNEECMNCQVVGYIKHEPSNDGSTVFAKLGTTANADAFGQE